MTRDICRGDRQPFRGNLSSAFSAIETMNILPCGFETRVNFADLELPCSHLNDVNVIKEVILCFWGHVLYIRNQIPLPLKNFTEGALKIQTGEPKSKSKSNGIKKLSDFDLRYQDLSKSLNSLLTGLHESQKFSEIKSVCVMIGPSASSTLREAYYLDFDIDYKSLEGVRCSLSQRDQCKRQLVRTMISNWDSDMTSSPITNSFVAIHFQGSASTALEIQQRLLASGETSDFNMKESLNIKVRKKSPPCFHLRISASDYSNLSCAERSIEDNENSNPIEANFWLVLRKGIKGVKSFG